MTILKKEKREDLRTRMTRKMITDAMFRLMEQRKFEAITVADICEEASVHRTTFYKHFEDKYQLLHSMIENLYHQYHADLVQDAPFECPADYYCNLIRRFLPLLYANQKVCSLILENDGNNVVISSLHQFLIKDVVKRIQEYEALTGNKGYIPAVMDAELHVGGLESLIIWWLKNNQPCSEEDLYRYIEYTLYESHPPDTYVKKDLSTIK